MAFHDDALPSDIEYGSAFGGGFQTLITATATGHEYRVGRQAAPTRRMRLVADLKTSAQASALRTHALARRGSLHTFPAKDFGDFTTATDGVSAHDYLDCLIATGDGVETQFQLLKTYAAGEIGQLSLPITLPVDGTVRVGVNGTEVFNWTLTRPGGIITFDAPPADTAQITAGFEFDVQVRYESAFDKWAGMRAAAFNTWSAQDLQVMSVHDELEWPEQRFPGGVHDWGAVGSDVTLSFAQGVGHRFTPTTTINALLPQPPTLFPGGMDIFAIYVPSGSSVQVRDHLGATIGSPVSAGNLKWLGAVVISGSVSWFLY